MQIPRLSAQEKSTLYVLHSAKRYLAEDRSLNELKILLGAVLVVFRQLRIFSSLAHSEPQNTDTYVKPPAQSNYNNCWTDCSSN